MPYISLTERSKFSRSIEDIMGILRDPNDSPYVKGEYFGFVVNRIIKKFLIDPDYVKNAFNSAFFNEVKKKTLANAADSIAAVINRADPIHSVGELVYAISAIHLGLLGFAAGVEDRGYGFKIYLKAIIERVHSTVESQNAATQKDVSMAFRRHLVARGVLMEVIEESKTAMVVPANVDLPKDQVDLAIWNTEGSLALQSTVNLTKV